MSSRRVNHVVIDTFVLHRNFFFWRSFAYTALVVMATKRKYAELLIEEKRQLCEFKKKNPRFSQEQLAEWCQRQFGKSPSRSAIGGILQHSEKYMNSPAATPARDRDPMCPKLEQAVLLWLNARCQLVGISEEMLRTKAKEFAENPELEVPESSGVF